MRGSKFGGVAIGLAIVASAFIGSSVEAYASADIFSVSRLIELASPESHCNQNHDHHAKPRLNTNEQLDWSASDDGFNEGAGPALSALQLAGIPGPVIDGIAGNVWPRWAMMEFALELNDRGAKLAGVALAILSQWHNCHAFAWLATHPGEVAAWLDAH